MFGSTENGVISVGSMRFLLFWFSPKIWSTGIIKLHFGLGVFSFRGALLTVRSICLEILKLLFL